MILNSFERDPAQSRIQAFAISCIEIQILNTQAPRLSDSRLDKIAANSLVAFLRPDID